MGSQYSLLALIDRLLSSKLRFEKSRDELKMIRIKLVKSIRRLTTRLRWLPLIILTTASSVSADSIPDVYNAVTIEDAVVLAAQTGGNSELRFRLVNESSENLILIGVTSESVSDASILAQTGHGLSEKLASIPVRAEETLDLHSSHLKIELTGLKRNFLRGELVPLTLVMLRGGIPIIAHVH